MRFNLGVFLSLGILLPSASPSATQASDPIVLKNRHLQARFSKRDGAWRITQIAREDGRNTLELESDEFEILLLDDRRFTVADYEAARQPERETENGLQILRLAHRRKAATDQDAPSTVTVTYSLGNGPILHKRLEFPLAEGAIVDRLQVQRFSTATPAHRGGHGEPVFIGDWFFGVDYPGFHSRHDNAFKEPDYYYRIHFAVDLEGRDREFAPRPGLVTLFHFPGLARKLKDGRFGIAGKRAVIGISATPGESAELGLVDYIASTSKQPRSYLHFNNWYSPKGKAITVENFADGVCKTIQERLRPYGVQLDAMVPDHGWENSKSFRKIFEPRLDESHEPLSKVRDALERRGTKLGIWIALDGYNQSLDRGLEVGYQSAFRPDFKKRPWMERKPFFNMLQPKYLQDLREALRFLIADAGVDYIKLDLNHNFTTHHLTERHGRERCLDTTLELLAYQRSLHPGIYQNYTNGTWFSPFWLQQVDCLWMMSGDAGGTTGGNWPQISLRDVATSYRDRHFFQTFNNPARCPRPLIPISRFMTHGILFAKQKPFTNFKDTALDWANYVVMYYARGTLLKELYISPELFNDEHWSILGTATRWAQKNADRMVNSLYFGGDPKLGQAYGFVSWVGDRAALAVRNPHRKVQTVTVPFDASVYFRGAPGKPYRARAVYPFVEPMPWTLTSGTAFPVSIPGDSVVIYELEPGKPSVTTSIRAEPLPDARGAVVGDRFEIDLTVPDEAFGRYDLLIEPWGDARPLLTINGSDVTEPTRTLNGKRWTLSSYDLRAHRGGKVKIRGSLKLIKGAAPPKRATILMDAWLVVDRKVTAPPAPRDESLPPALCQTLRRLTQELIPKTPIEVKSR